MKQDEEKLVDKQSGLNFNSVTTNMKCFVQTAWNENAYHFYCGRYVLYCSHGLTVFLYISKNLWS